MTWTSLLANKEAQKHKTSKKELDNMRALIARDLADASLAGLSADRRFATAYNAALQAANMAIACAGYRIVSKVGHHRVSLESTKLVLGKAAHKYADYFDSNQTKITWKHESGFSLQFYFHRIGFAPLVWGFPAKTRDGKSSRQRLDFPFDFSLRAGVPEIFVNDFGASLSSLVPLSGGGKRPSIPISALSADETSQIIGTVFSFAAKASKK